MPRGLRTIRQTQQHLCQIKPQPRYRISKEDWRRYTMDTILPFFLKTPNKLFSDMQKSTNPLTYYAFYKRFLHNRENDEGYVNRHVNSSITEAFKIGKKEIETLCGHPTFLMEFGRKLR